MHSIVFRYYSTKLTMYKITLRNFASDYKFFMIETFSKTIPFYIISNTYTYLSRKMYVAKSFSDHKNRLHFLYLHTLQQADWIDFDKSVCQYLRQELYIEMRTARHSLRKTLCNFHCLFLWYLSLCKRAT